MYNLKGVNRSVNRTINRFFTFKTSFVLLLINFLKCIPLSVKVVEQNKNLFHNFCEYKTNYLKTFPQNFQKSYRSFHVARPSTRFTIGIPSALNRRPMYNLSATFVGDKAIESRPTLIRVKGNVSTY